MTATSARRAAHEWWPLLAVAAAWAFAPLAELIVDVIRHGGVLTGAYGADAYDQLAYLAWIRDAGHHWLAGDLWRIPATARDDLHPLYLISGLLVRLGAGVALAALVWKPVALLTLVLGTAALAGRVLPERRAERLLAAGLGLFYVAPWFALAERTGALSPGHRFSLLLATNDAYNALDLWGFDHTAIAVGLMPVCLLAGIRALTAAPRRPRRPRPPARPVALACATGALIAWLRPWQGVTVAAVLAGLALLAPLAEGRTAPAVRRRVIAVVPVLAAIALPLLYGVLLARSDPAWRDFQSRTTHSGTAPAWALALSLGPLLVPALVGARRLAGRRGEPLVQALLLWPLAAAAVYLLVPEFPPHALAGVTVPLAVLAVIGVRGLGRPFRLAALALVAPFTVLGAADQAWNARQDLADPSRAAARQLVELTADQAAALRVIARSGGDAGVLAPPLLDMTVPAATGHPSFAGHLMWVAAGDPAVAAEVFAPATAPAARRALVVRARVGWLLADCATPAAVDRDVLPLTAAARRYGCVRLLWLRGRLRPRGRAAGRAP